MGRDIHWSAQVLGVSSDNNETLRSYAFRGSAPSPWAFQPQQEEDQSVVTLLVINLDNTTAAVADVSRGVHGAASSAAVWSLTPGESGPLGSGTRMNGEDLPTKMVAASFNNTIPVAPHYQAASEPFGFPPLSVTFVVLF
mmetsp:Transcript_36197/g.83995  ORF Transcript_36197/g.83995 Transcript_36197/m.83995 type:complete len:140 (+) Transcript_36197:451-870(+)